MNRNLLLLLASTTICAATFGRTVRIWSAAELQNASDLVVIGRPVATTDLEESNSLGWASTPSFHPEFRGVETTFKVSNVIKGMPANDRIVLHHYRYDEKWGSPPNGPTLITFDPGATNDYILYLVRESPDRYAPAAGQMDSALSMAQPPATTGHTPGFPMFPVLPPVADADPAIRYPVSIKVPTRLKIERISDLLSMEIDTNGFEPVVLMVGTNMATGVESRTFVYPEGEKRSGQSSLGWNSGLVFGSEERVWHTSSDHFPLPGHKYIVEVELSAFETDIPPQHMWDPHGKNYKILWQRTLKQTVE